MRYIVHGQRTEIISIEVDADSEEEAFQLAEDSSRHDVDVWDDDTQWYAANVQ